MMVSVEHVYSGGSAAARVGQNIEFSFILKNDGLLDLFNMTIESEYLEARGSLIACSDPSGDDTVGVLPGSVSGIASLPSSGITPGQHVTCTGTIALLQEEVRALIDTRKCSMSQSRTGGASQSMYALHVDSRALHETGVGQMAVGVIHIYIYVSLDVASDALQSQIRNSAKVCTCMKPGTINHIHECVLAVCESRRIPHHSAIHS